MGKDGKWENWERGNPVYGKIRKGENKKGLKPEKVMFTF